MKTKILLSVLIMLVTLLQTSCSDKEKFLVSSLSLSQQSIEITEGESITLSVTIYPFDASNPELIWKSSNPNVASVDQTGKITAVSAGNCSIICRANDGSGAYVECAVKVYAFHDFVDLDLPSGTLWATCNMGASNPEEYGDYYAWGETTIKSEYTWNTYIYCKGTDITLTKYCTRTSDGFNSFYDGLTILQPEDDVALANWGPSWRMPTKEQFEELIHNDNTAQSRIYLNNVMGLKITSLRNGNSIFLPDVNFRGYYRPYDIDEENGSYWSCSLRNSSPSTAYYLAITSHGYINDVYRSCGLHIRPVRTK